MKTLGFFGFAVLPLVLCCAGEPSRWVDVDPPAFPEGGADDGGATTTASPDGGTSGAKPDAGQSGPGADAGVDAGPDAGADAGAAAADPGLPGPWRAGTRTVTLRDPTRSRTLPLEVWYPADPVAPGGSANEYKISGLFGTIATIKTPALRGATPAPGRWPLVVFSHGYGGIRFQSYFLTEHLATHGFVVAAPDHPGNTLTDFGKLGDDAATAQSAVDRPLDVLFVLDQMIAGTSGVPVAVDPARAAVTGHSFGGWTALEVVRRDARWRAVFPMAPGFRNGASPSFVANLARPLFVFGGDKDKTTPFETDQKAPYDLAVPPKFLVKVLGAGHLDFSNLCEVPIASLFVKDGCNTQNIDPKEVHARVRLLSVAFVRRSLDGDLRYDRYLDPSFVTGLGKLEYWRSP